MKKSTLSLIRQLKQSREVLGLTQKDLAHMMGIPQSHLSKIESGVVDIQLSNFTDLARLLGLEVMLVPRGSVKLVESLSFSQNKYHQDDQQPAYTLDDEHNEVGSD